MTGVGYGPLFLIPLPRRGRGSRRRPERSASGVEGRGGTHRASAVEGRGGTHPETRGGASSPPHPPLSPQGERETRTSSAREGSRNRGATPSRGGWLACRPAWRRAPVGLPAPRPAVASKDEPLKPPAATATDENPAQPGTETRLAWRRCRKPSNPAGDNCTGAPASPAADAGRPIDLTAQPGRQLPTLGQPCAS